MVVIFFPATAETGVMHERVASPLIWTVQAPQRAMPQPNLVPVLFNVSRSTQSRGMSGLTSTDSGLPFKVKLIAMGTSLPRDISYTNFPPLRKTTQIRRKPGRAPPAQQLSRAGLMAPIWPRETREALLPSDARVLR